MKTKLLLLVYSLLVSLSINTFAQNATETVCTGQITSLKFDDTSGGNADVTIVNNGVYDISDLPSTFIIEALTSGTLESVGFTLSGSASGTKTENTSPYNYPASNWAHGMGSFKMVVKAYSADNLGGTLCNTKEFNFTIQDSKCTCPNSLVLNGSFESYNGSNVPNSWTPENGTIVSADYGAQCGQKSAHFKQDGSGNIGKFYQYVPNIVPGTKLSLSFFAGVHDPEPANAFVKIIFYNGNNPLPTGVAMVEIDYSPLPGMQFYTLTAEAPANTTRLRIEGSTDGESGSDNDGKDGDWLKVDAFCLNILCIPVTAGTDGTHQICDNNLTPFNLFDYITGEQTGGAWTLNGQPVSNMVTPVAGNSIKEYIYTVTGTAPCGNDESKVTVTIKAKAYAGTDGSYEVCSNALTQINLNDYINDEQPGGTWTVNGQPIANPFTPTAGTSTTEYIYTVVGNTPCGNDQSKVTVKVFPTPMISVEAGPDGEVCANLPGQQLPDGSLEQTTPKKYQLNGTMSGATSVLWTADVPGGSFDDATKLDAIYTPPVGANTIVLTLTSNDPDGPCASAKDQLTITTVACAGILDPCVCHEVTYLPSETMEVEDFIEIDGASGQEWTIIVNGGAPRTPAQGGGVYGTMQLLDYVPPMDNTPVPIGTVVPETPAGSGIYRYDFAHDSGAGYNVTVRNTQTGQELSISNFCVLNTFQPNFTVGATICNNGSPFNLTSLITDTDPTTSGPAVVDPVGTVDYYYVVAGNPTENPISTVFNPGDYPDGTTVKIIAKYIPNAANVVDCQVIREATGNFTVINCPLSVNLISFSGRVADESVVLNWKTTDEKDFSHYEIQKSTNAKEFATIGSVNGNAAKYYNFTDNNPAFADNYYRLKIVNNDGSYETSKTISLNFEKNKNFVNIENPSVDGSFTIGTNMKNPSFSILTSNGTKIGSTTISNGLNKYVVKPTNATAGLYFLNIVSEGKVVTKKVIVR
jgi:hypothetical protein